MPNTDTLLSPQITPLGSWGDSCTQGWPCGVVFVNLHCGWTQKVATVQIPNWGHHLGYKDPSYTTCHPADRRCSTRQGQRDFPRETAVFWPRTVTQ